MITQNRITMRKSEKRSENGVWVIAGNGLLVAKINNIRIVEVNTFEKYVQ